MVTTAEGTLRSESEKVILFNSEQMCFRRNEIKSRVIVIATKNSTWLEYYDLIKFYVHMKF